MGNELKLSFENFQSISSGSMVFHTGTNVIIGQSNSGKTATFRGLKTCLNNPSGSQRFIKKGTAKASVSLEYNGNQIIWKRTPKESSYTINGEDFLKTGKSNAFKIVEDTGFVVDDNDVIMNIEEELQLPFPFGISKSELFKLYENVFCVSDSAVILKAAKEQEENTKNEIFVLENEITKNKNKMEEILKFKSEVDMDFLIKRKSYFQEKLKRVEYLKEGIDTIRKACKFQNFEILENSFNNKLPEIEELQYLNSTILKLKLLHKVNKELKDKQLPPSINISYYKELCKLSDQCRKIIQLEEVKTPEREFSNKLEQYCNLREYKASLRSLMEHIDHKKKKLKEIENNIDMIEGTLKKVKICPLCHQPMNK